MTSQVYNDATNQTQENDAIDEMISADEEIHLEQQAADYSPTAATEEEEHHDDEIVTKKAVQQPPIKKSKKSNGTAVKGKGKRQATAAASSVTADEDDEQHDDDNGDGPAESALGTYLFFFLLSLALYIRIGGVYPFLFVLAVFAFKSFLDFSRYLIEGN